MTERQRYAVVGTGSRARLYIRALAERFVDTSELVALCDSSEVRMAWHASQIALHCPGVARYRAEEFDRMLTETKPDTVVVTTVDCFHADYIISALDRGCDVITEKPVAISAEQLKRVIAAERRSGHSVRVIFNARYSPEFSTLRRLLQEARIGTVRLVELAEILDTSHGADYFRRWHREKENSGGLLMHKACHHFDLVNWWLSAAPRRVFAMGSLAFYGRQNAERRGEHYRYDRYTSVPEAAGDPFGLFLDRSGDDGSLRGLYLDAERETGYIRDRNVFSAGIDIEDTAAVVVSYDNAAILNYTLVAYSPWEGMRLTLTGDRGRIELEERMRSERPGSDRPLAGLAREAFCRVTVYPMFGEGEAVDVAPVEGGHEVADATLLEELFSGQPVDDPLGRAATLMDGVAAVLIGDAANRSLATGQAIDCASLLDRGLTR